MDCSYPVYRDQRGCTSQARESSAYKMHPPTHTHIHVPPHSDSQSVGAAIEPNGFQSWSFTTAWRPRLPRLLFLYPSIRSLTPQRPKGSPGGLVANPRVYVSRAGCQLRKRKLLGSSYTYRHLAKHLAMCIYRPAQHFGRGRGKRIRKENKLDVADRCQ